MVRTRDASQQAYDAARAVVDPELPMLTLEDLGVLRSVRLEGGTAVATITPTYSGCPAMATMRDDLVHRLAEAGFTDARIEVALHPAWSSDDITERGRAALARHGISPPGQARHETPVALILMPVRRSLHCPQCGSTEVRLTSEFGATACKALYRCVSCLEPFEHVKEI